MGLIVLLIIEAVFVALCFSGEFLAVSLAFSILLFAIIIFYTLATFLFSIKVDGSQFKISTRAGRKYIFSCSDIEEVECYETTGSKTRMVFHIIIKIKKRSFYIDSGMIKFKNMAKYLLEKYEIGEIKESAFTNYSKKKLPGYSIGEIEYDEEDYINIV